MSCVALLDQIVQHTSNTSNAYISLLKNLTLDKNAVTSSDLAILLAQTHVINPLDVITPSVSSEQAFAYHSAFNQILHSSNARELDWEYIKSEIANLISERAKVEKDGNAAKRDTREVFAPKVLDVIKNSVAKHPYGYGSPEYFIHNDEPYVSYLISAGKKVVVINLRSKVSEVLPVKRNQYRISEAFGKNGHYLISSEWGDFKIYPIQGNFPILPPRTVSKKRHSSGGIALSQKDGRDVLVKIDDRFPQGRIWFIPLSDASKLTSAEITNDLSSPKIFELDGHSIVGFVGEGDNVYFFNLSTAKLMSQPTVVGARGNLEFYEIFGEPRAFVTTLTGGAILNPITGKRLKSMRFKNSNFPVPMTLFKSQGLQFAVLQTSADEARILDLQTNLLLKRKIDLGKKWNAVLSSNISSFTFNRRPLLVWATKASPIKGYESRIIIFDPIDHKIVHEAVFKHVDGIRLIAPYSIDGHSEAIVVPNVNSWNSTDDDLPFVMRLTATASPQTEGEP